MQSERSWQAQVTDYATLRGWRVFHIADSRRGTATGWVGDRGVRGLPDLILVRPPRVIFAELKSERGRLRDSQKEVLALLSNCNSVEVYLWRPSDFDEMVEVLK